MTDRLDELARDLGQPLAPDERIAEPDRAEQEPAAEIVMPVPDGTPAPSFRHRALGEPAQVWTYNDAAGQILGHVARFDRPGERKEFLPRTLWRDGNRVAWQWKSWPKHRPLYGLDRLAANPAAPVIVAEGEKAADAAQRIFPKFVAVTCSGGSKAAGTADWGPLAGRPATIWPDADAPGLQYGIDVERELTAVGAGPVTTIDAMRVAATLPTGESRRPPEGWDAADGLEEGWTPEALAELALAHVEPVEPPRAPPRSSASDLKWPSGFSMRATGLWFEPEGDEPALRVAGHFRVLGLARDPSGASWSTAIEWLDLDQGPHRSFVARADLVGDGIDWLKPLVDAGLPVSIGRKSLTLLKRALFELDCYSRVRTVRRSGWFGNAFVLPKSTIGHVNGEEIVFEGRADAARYAESGTLEEWVSTVAAPAAGNSRLVLALCVAFAGPVADLLQDEGGGVNLRGGSSTGKTTALILAGSVWGGGGRAGYTQTWRATGNGLESVAKAHSGTVLVLDELGELEAREAGATAYLLVNGQGKARATKDAELRARHEWRVMLLSAGEIGLADKIAETGRRARAGQLVRLVDVPADANHGLGLFEDAKGREPADFAREIKTAALTTYGTAGPSFVTALADDIEGTIETARAMIAECTKVLLTDMPDPDGQASRAAHRFALIAAAGKMAQIALGLPWRQDEVADAIKTCFSAWRATRGGDGPGELVAALDAIRGAIERHGEARFRRLDDIDAAPAPIRDLLGYRLRRDDQLVYAFTATGWSEMLAGVADPKVIVTMLYQRGVLLAGRDRTHRLFLKIDGRSVPTYAVRASAVFDEEAA